MLESLLFVLFVIIGTIALVGAVMLFLIGTINKNKSIKNIASYILIIPIGSYGIIAIFYLIIQPYNFNSLAKESAGVYYISGIAPLEYQVILEDNKNFTLVLKEDGTYYINDVIPELKLERKGKWNIGGIDGMFEFKNLQGNIIDFASYYGSKDKFMLEFSCYFSDDWQESGYMRFKKRNIN